MSLLIEEVNKEETVIAEGCGFCGISTGVDEEGISYIICQPCYSKFINVSAAYKKQLDELPFGVIDLNAQATIMAFNRVEADLAQVQAEKVIGKNFFTEVAPCAAVKEFQGRFHEFIIGTEQTLRFNFTFSFRHGPVDVEIFFLRNSMKRAVNQNEQHTRIIIKRLTK